MGLHMELVGVGLREETLTDYFIKQFFQVVKVAGDIQDARGFGLDAQLRPGEHFKKLVERADAAGQRDKGVGELSHERLSFEHGIDDAEFGEAAVSGFKIHQLFSDDSGYIAVGGEAGVGHHSHQSDTAATIDQADSPFGQIAPDGGGGVGIDWVAAFFGTAENA